MKFKNTQCRRFAILEIRNIPENWNLCKLDSQWFKLAKPISKLRNDKQNELIYLNIRMR